MIMADKYREKEIGFLEGLYEGVADEEVDSAYSIISKIESNLKRMKEEI